MRGKCRMMVGRGEVTMGVRNSWQKNRGADIVHLVDPSFGEGSLFEPGLF